MSMNEEKTSCSKCGVEFLKLTAERTGGLCMPCKNGTPKRPDLNEPIEVRCSVSSMAGSNPVFHTTAQLLLEVLEGTRHVGDSSHPNRYELEAQRALLRHVIRHHIKFRLNDDHWGRTGWAIIGLFERGLAEMEIDGKRYQFAELQKSEWKEGDHPLAMQGGFSYRNFDGAEYFKVMSWVS